MGLTSANSRSVKSTRYILTRRNGLAELHNPETAMLICSSRISYIDIVHSPWSACPLISSPRLLSLASKDTAKQVTSHARHALSYIHSHLGGISPVIFHFC